MSPSLSPYPYAGLGQDSILTSELRVRDAQHTSAREHGRWMAGIATGSVRCAVRTEPRGLVLKSVEYDEADLVPVPILRADHYERPDGARVTFVVLRDPQDRLSPITVGQA